MADRGPRPRPNLREAKRVYSLSFNFPLRQGHSLAERFGIGDPFGFGGAYTRMVTDRVTVPVPDMPDLPASLPAVASSATIQPFPPETALAEATVHGRGLYVETAQVISGLDQAARWLRQLVLADYPDLLEPPARPAVSGTTTAGSPSTATTSNPVEPAGHPAAPRAPSGPR